MEVHTIAQHVLEMNLGMLKTQRVNLQESLWNVLETVQLLAKKDHLTEE